MFSGWHRRLNKLSGISPPFYVLLQVLYHEAREVDTQVHLVGELKARSHRPNFAGAFLEQQGGEVEFRQRSLPHTKWVQNRKHGRWLSGAPLKPALL